MEISKAHNLMKSALNYRAVRQNLISSNISNIDTPFYKSRDINFESALSYQANKIFDGEKDQELKLAKTDGQHLKQDPDYHKDRGTLFLRDGHYSRNDGNSVDLDVETTEMSKNSTMFRALVASMKKDSMIFKSVVSASEKLN